MTRKRFVNIRAELVSNRAGFTLIELLVVVLIIGILASVAVPQYEKAVLKSRAAEQFQIQSSMRNALSVWLLANGYQDALFTGSSADAYLDVDVFAAMDCVSSSNQCKTKWLSYGLNCTSGRCEVYSTMNRNGGRFYSLQDITAPTWQLHRCLYQHQDAKPFCDQYAAFGYDSVRNY